MLGKLGTSLKTKLLILFFTLNLACVLLVGITSLQSKRAALKEVAENNLSVITVSLADKVDRFMAGRVEDIDSMALHYSLEGLKTTTSGQNRILAEYLKIHPYFDHISIINVEDIGVPKRMAEHAPGYDSKWYLPALDGRPVCSDMYISPLTDKPTYSFAAPVREKDGRIVSLLTANLKLSYLWDIVDEVRKENAKKQMNGYAYMLNREGMPIAHPDRKMILARRITDFAEPKLKAVALAMTQGRSGTSDYVYEGVDKVVTYAPCKGYGSYQGDGWSLAVTMPYSELLAPMKRLMAMYVLLFLATSVLALYVSNRLADYLVRPILALKNGASRIGAGNFNMRINIESRDEIGDLAESFNRMAETLQARDDEIARSTASISYINMELEKKQEDLAQANEVLTRTNDELRILEKQKAEFLAMITHDIKSPLSTVIAYSDMILSGSIKDGDELKSAIASVQASADKVLKLVQNYLVSSAIEAGELRLVQQPMDMNEFVESQVQFFMPQMERKGIAFTLDKTEGLPKVMADKMHLDRALSNIVTNAVKFTPRGGWIRIHTYYSGPWVTVDVSDSGGGIPEDEIDTLFNKYRRSKATGRVDGQGLGLFISRAIVEAHGGAIAVSSNIGKGSTFSIILPARQSTGTQTE